ncbi:ATP-dependent DNA helicase Rep [Vibrio mediterranei AK1]|nr:ATP-dependent DNA helicase Rep [Vibrio mediterranei AK1]
MKLNPQQDMAVKYVSGPCLVLAGAGSGKTRVITNKIAYLVQSCGYKARNIAAVTFTNKAAREMKERVGQTLGKNESKGLMVSTFHTMGLNIIRREYKALGLKAGFSLFDDQDQMALLKELTEQQLDGDKDLLRSLLGAISNWKNDMLTPEQVKGSARSEQEQLFAHCYEMYQVQMKRITRSTLMT